MVALALSVVVSQPAGGGLGMGPGRGTVRPVSTPRLHVGGRLLPGGPEVCPVCPGELGGAGEAEGGAGAQGSL